MVQDGIEQNNAAIVLFFGIGLPTGVVMPIDAGRLEVVWTTCCSCALPEDPPAAVVELADGLDEPDPEPDPLEPQAVKVASDATATTTAKRSRALGTASPFLWARAEGSYELNDIEDRNASSGRSSVRWTHVGNNSEICGVPPGGQAATDRDRGQATGPRAQGGAEADGCARLGKDWHGCPLPAW